MCAKYSLAMILQIKHNKELKLKITWWSFSVKVQSNATTTIWFLTKNSQTTTYLLTTLEYR